MAERSEESLFGDSNQSENFPYGKICTCASRYALTAVCSYTSIPTRKGTKNQKTEATGVAIMIFVLSSATPNIISAGAVLRQIGGKVCRIGFGQLALAVITVISRRMFAVIGERGQRARRVVRIGIYKFKCGVGTCIIPYFFHSVKRIVQIFYLETVSIGQNAQFTVVCVILIACQRVPARLDLGGVSKVVVGEGVRCGCRLYRLQAVERVVGVVDLGTARNGAIAARACQRGGLDLDQISDGVVGIGHAVALGIGDRRTHGTVPCVSYLFDYFFLIF